ncbi:hypothetical protein HMPREF0765_1268 [Sphingobacterium spiritivorum ATCC 33300]|uniref:Phytase-like domain-containing protein n=1 Tax=Sphingobacterium spiritivorum ATCC 33300 TaxID=525372 RepID=C2FVB2_SPHSI|nr:hypothetical protein [Sphingobacterium spiritivorum]EEI93131.1 hypothetical protein HMPREF0765_1268 [Sphingobacterium spiritivorum ATCC 33300]QQS96136.1 hypothetical protein I6J03_00020 [Sphingobacterium spiritivorum]
MIKLAIKERFSLPETSYILDRRSIILDNGTFVTLAEDLEGVALVTLANGHMHTIIADSSDAFENHHSMMLLAFKSQIGLLEDLSTLKIWNTDLDISAEISITGKELFNTYSMFGLTPRISGVSAIGQINNTYAIIFSEPIASQNNRYLAFLHIDFSKQTAQWQQVISLNTEDYPMDRFGGFEAEDMPEDPPIIGHVISMDDKLLAFAEGSDTMSLNRYGMDFFTYGEIDSSGKLINRLLEQKGFKRDTKKHGVRGVFTSSQQYLILTPVFKSDEWKGKQKLLSIQDNKLLDIELPRGFKDFKVIEHFNEEYWLTDNRNEILCCTEITV